MIAGSTIAVPEVTRPAGVWAYISPSRLNLWLKCPLAFKLRYIDGVRSPSSASQFVGKVVHAALEDYYRHRQLGLTKPCDVLLARLVDRWEQDAVEEDMRFASVAAESTCREQAACLIAAYLTAVPVDEPRPLAVEVTAESPLVDPSTGEDLGIPLLGIMDLVLPQTDGPVIADFKTAARSSGSLEIMHEIQLTCYSYLFRQASGQQESALEIRSLIKTKVPKIEICRFPQRSYAHFRRLFAVVRTYLDALDSGKFVYRPGLGCGYCDLQGKHCTAWAG